MATLNRRQVLQSSVVTAAAATTLYGVTPASAAPAATKPAKSLFARSRFVPLIGATFSMKSPVATWQARLDVIGDLFPLLEPADDDRFSLSFSTTQPGPPQGTFTFVRPGFEATPLFVIPDAERRHYLAIVNRV